MRRSAAVLFLLILACISAKAQVVESADLRTFRVDAGAMASGFAVNDGGHALYGPGAKYLGGIGAYVDLHFTHWIQLEGEARWLRFHEYAGENQDMYLIGPKVPVVQFRRAQVYGKALIGAGKMTFPSKYGYGTFTALAFGGGVDYPLSRKLTLRPIDFEYQVWPKFLPGSSLHPYGVSVGVAYRVF